LTRSVGCILLSQKQKRQRGYAMKFSRLFAAGAMAAAVSFATPGYAQNTVKVGLLVPMTGPFTSTGKQLVAGARLYMHLKGDTVAGKKIELIVKDDAGNPEMTKRLAQELVVNDKVAVLA
jgi:branched-chain amino acid transport system substrate-binding protein